MSQNRETREVQNPALLAIGGRRDVLIWRNQVGKFRPVVGSGVVSIGTPGAADSIGVVAMTIRPEHVGRVVGVALAAEYKTATGRLSQAQLDWRAAFEQRGGCYVVARSPADLVNAVDAITSGYWLTNSNSLRF